MAPQLEKFLATFKKEIKTVQSYEGETYSEELKKSVAKLVRLKSVSRYQVAKHSGINYTLIRNWDMKYNHGLTPDGYEISA